MQQAATRATTTLLWAGLLFVLFVGAWHLAARAHLFPDSLFPAPLAVLEGFGTELGSGRMPQDLLASIYRVTFGFVIAVAMSLPLGLWLGTGLRAASGNQGGHWNTRLAVAVLPYINFFRFLSPLAWIPFAVLWFGVGDNSPIFLIFLSVFFPVVLSVAAAVANIPAVYFRVAEDYGLKGARMLTGVTLPAIMPQFITSLRVTAGVAWMVVVAAEMLAGKDGLGFAIWDARNGLRVDLLVVEMVVIGLIGILIDFLIAQLTRLPMVRWGYER